MSRKVAFEKRSSLSALLTALLLGLFVYASSAGAQEVGPPIQHVVRLHYAEDGFSLSVDIDVEKREVAFKQEPDFGPGKVVRSALPVGGDDAQAVGFAWDKAKCTLYVDLNRNFDLTDDPSGTYQAEGEASGFGQVFRGVRASSQSEPLTFEYILDVEMADYPWGLECEVTVRSGWQADTTLYGETRHLGVVDNMDGVLGREDKLVVRTPGADWRSFDEAGSPDAEALPDRIFFGGHCYEPTFAFDAGTTGVEVVATLAEVAPPMGELKIEGVSIKRLRLHPLAGADFSLVVLDLPEQTVSVPVGEYNQQTAYVDGGTPGTLFCAIRDTRLSVREGSTVTLKVGGPLKRTISATRRGGSLSLSYRLVGAGGEDYLPLVGRYDNPPTFAIYRGDKRVASGKFEYG